MTCVRRAWLTLGTQSIELHNPDNGWVCSTLDLGYPEVREVVNNRPDQNGIDDHTLYWGARAVTADIVVSTSWGARIDAVADDFAPYMIPNARPTLHWILDRPGTPERTLTVRAAGYDWALDNDYQRDVHLAWVAADPVARDPTVRTAIAWSGSTTAQGRVYNLTFDRTYPVGGGTGGNVLVMPGGDVPVWPLYRIYGPITGPGVRVNIRDDDAGPISRFCNIRFLASFTISAGEWVDVDSADKTAFYNSDPNRSVLGSIWWSMTNFYPLQPAPPGSNSMGLTGTSTSGVTQVQAIWQDGYLS